MPKVEAKEESKKGRKKKEEVVEANVEEKKTEIAEQGQKAVTEETEKGKAGLEAEKKEPIVGEEETKAGTVTEEPQKATVKHSQSSAASPQYSSGKEESDAEKMPKASEKKAKAETALEKKVEPKEKKVVVISEKALEIISAVEKMTVLELSDLVKALEERFGVVATAPVAPMPTATPTVGKEEEKTEWSVHLTAVGEKKIQVIKEVRAVTNLGLKEAKTLVEEAPKSVKEGMSKKEAEEIKAKLESAGATVELK